MDRLMLLTAFDQQEPHLKSFPITASSWVSTTQAWAGASARRGGGELQFNPSLNFFRHNRSGDDEIPQEVPRPYQGL